MKNKISEITMLMLLKLMLFFAEKVKIKKVYQFYSKSFTLKLVIEVSLICVMYLLIYQHLSDYFNLVFSEKYYNLIVVSFIIVPVVIKNILMAFRSTKDGTIVKEIVEPAKLDYKPVKRYDIHTMQCPYGCINFVTLERVKKELNLSRSDSESVFLLSIGESFHCGSIEIVYVGDAKSRHQK